MRIAVACLLALHGVIHALGFADAFSLARLPALRDRTLFAVSAPVAKLIGVLWLIAAVALVGAAALLLARARAWWAVAAAGVVLSQLLVVWAWPAAKVGTVANALLLLPIAIGWGDARFQRDTDALARSLFARVPPAPGQTVTTADLVDLPAPVRRWLGAAGIVDRPRVRSVRLRQRGRMRTAPDQAFMPAGADQYFTVDQPGFVWRVRVRMKHLLPVVGRDSWIDGAGRMRIDAASLVTLVDAAGPRIDQGTLLRWLGEIVWFPSAALSPYIRWEPLDDASARAVMSYRGVTAAAVFRFTEDGRFLEMSARRYMGSGADATLEEWVARARAWRRHDGVLIPVEGDVQWRLAAGPFTYYEWEITAVEYDRPALYPRESST